MKHLLFTFISKEIKDTGTKAFALKHYDMEESRATQPPRGRIKVIFLVIGHLSSWFHLNIGLFLPDDVAYLLN